MTVALEGGEWSAARPGRTLPPGKTRYPFYRRLGGSQGRCRRAENLVPTRIRSPDRPARSSVTIPTELTSPRMIAYNYMVTYSLTSISSAFHRSCFRHIKIDERLSKYRPSQSRISGYMILPSVMSGLSNHSPLFLYNWDRSIASIPTDWRVLREAITV